MMSSATYRASFGIRIMLLVLFCALFMPAHSEAGDKNEMESFRIASLTLAVSGISNPASQLKTFADSDSSSLRSPGKRQQNVTSGCDGGDTPAVLPVVPPLPDFFLCAQEHFELRSWPPESHGLIHWFSLAPPSSRNV